MNESDAKSLLDKISQTKSAKVIFDLDKKLDAAKDLILPSGPAATPGYNEVQDVANAALKRETTQQVLKYLALGAAGGAAFRGLGGLLNMTSGSKPVPTSSVNMPVAYPSRRSPEDEDDDEKQAASESATKAIGLDYYLPSLVLGLPAATYAGFKGVDALLDRQRRLKTEEELERRKTEYEDALFGSYKQSSDSTGSSVSGNLDAAFSGLEKIAEESGSALDPATYGLPNLSGAARGAAMTYAIPASLMGYFMVNKMMQSGSKRKLVNKAMRERARRRAIQQPAGLYAIPVEKEEEED